MQNHPFLLIYRSLTYAQRSARTLERAGIAGNVSRVPKSFSGRGCGYGVSVSGRNRKCALEVLERAGLPPERVLEKHPDGTAEEVAHDLP